MQRILCGPTGRIAAVVLMLSLGWPAHAHAGAALKTTTRTPPPGSCYEGNLIDVLDLVGRAIALVEQRGAEAAFRRIMERGGGFVRGDLYVFVLDAEGRIVANGAAPESVGSNALAARDQNGRYFVRDILRRAYSVGDGWISYRWYSPCNGQWLDKQVYFKRSGRYVVCAGFYDTLAIHPHRNDAW